MTSIQNVDPCTLILDCDNDIVTVKENSFVLKSHMLKKYLEQNGLMSPTYYYYLLNQQGQR